MSNWISVKDRMPPRKEPVLTIYWDGIGRQKQCVGSQVNPPDATPIWVNDWQAYSPTHWMPLPEPPKP